MPERKFLTVFFSWGGHTRKAAKMVAETTGGELFELKPEKAYSKIYPICAAQAKKERDKNLRPAFAGGIADLPQYTDIVIGYPAWWYTCPMIVLSFLEQYDLTGRNVYLLTHTAEAVLSARTTSRSYAREMSTKALTEIT